MRLEWLPIALMLVAGTASADDKMQCKGWGVSVGMRTAEVLAKCGGPERREVERVPVRGKRADGGAYIRAYGQLEHWTYDRESGRLPALLTFEAGKLRRIALLVRR